MLQNGKLPRVFAEEDLKTLLDENSQGPMKHLRKGMNALGLIQVKKETSSFLIKYISVASDLLLLLSRI